MYIYIYICIYILSAECSGRNLTGSQSVSHGVALTKSIMLGPSSFPMAVIAAARLQYLSGITYYAPLMPFWHRVCMVPPLWLDTNRLPCCMWLVLSRLWITMLPHVLLCPNDGRDGINAMLNVLFNGSWEMAGAEHGLYQLEWFCGSQCHISVYTVALYARMVCWRCDLWHCLLCEQRDELF